MGPTGIRGRATQPLRTKMTNSFLKYWRNFPWGLLNSPAPLFPRYIFRNGGGWGGHFTKFAGRKRELSPLPLCRIECGRVRTTFHIPSRSLSLLAPLMRFPLPWESESSPQMSFLNDFSGREQRCWGAHSRPHSCSHPPPPPYLKNWGLQQRPCWCWLSSQACTPTRRLGPLWLWPSPTLISSTNAQETKSQVFPCRDVDCLLKQLVSV